MSVNKISIIGTGECASSLARNLVTGSLCKELMIVDPQGKRAQRLTADFKILASANSSRMIIKGSSYIKALEGSDIVVVVPAVYASDFDCREETFLTQLEAVKELSNVIKRTAPMSLILCASDYDDYLLVALSKYTGFSNERILAIDPSVEALALKAAFTEKLNVNPADVDVCFKSLGEQEEAHITIVGHDIADFMDKERVERVINAVTKEFRLCSGKARYAYSQSYVLHDFISAIVNDHAVVRSVMSISDCDKSSKECLGSFSTVICRCGIKRVIHSSMSGYVISKMQARLKEIKQCMM